MKLIIDIGGTHLRSSLYEIDIIKCETRPSKNNDLIEFIKGYLQLYSNINFIGISFAGQVKDGVILSSPNITVSRKNIKEYFEQKYPTLRLEIDNDLNCAIKAESAYHNESYISALYVGTGLGTATMDNGHIARGYNNQSFELGHIPYQKAPFKCGCGKDNCIELFASGLGLERWIEHYNSKDKKIDVNLAQLKKENSPLVKMFETALLYAVSILITISNSKIVVLGGGVIEKNPYLIDFIKQNISTQVMPTSLEGVKIIQSSLSYATLDGAKLLE